MAFEDAAKGVVSSSSPRRPQVQPEHELGADDKAVAGHVVVRGVSKWFGDHEVLRDASAAALHGEIAVFIGKSGSGKTTLLKIMGGLDKPTRGAVLIDGTDIVPLDEAALNAVRRRIGMVFQYSALLDWMTVFDNVAFPLREHTRLAPSDIRDRVASKLDILGLSEATERLPAELSGGMRKRVALARALILDPEIVMYDEPTSGLDPIMARVVDDLILRTRDRFGVTSIVISHDMAAAIRLADRMHLLAEGTVVASGTPRELLSGSGEQVREFIDSSAVDTERLLREHKARRMHQGADD
jgi:phospholipid/cholesterol/gamma-HCH transport system ATP-binding protein